MLTGNTGGKRRGNTISVCPCTVKVKGFSKPNDSTQILKYDVSFGKLLLLHDTCMACKAIAHQALKNVHLCYPNQMALACM